MKGFEERLNRLEELSEKIHDENVDLDQAMAFFEEGIKLARALENDLASVERKIEILVNQADSEEEKPVMELFPELNTGKE
ncbi:exodeoxyribonuclease VII small subunit [Marispirochaeta sp.]|jgi:exodeoxyribonuclease VII small subunit|uniref:exodeoxyribonuclease VII small subunit n=1 Tax=Marispirochaeta sp. TaxID=2038653 RepID=UPI0029C751D4|nr:exodeoxyribonuclease VII small subunit [Marispirochaeta sp.]